MTLANDTLFRIAGNSPSRGWGTAGANGAQVVLTAAQQAMAGVIIVDAISTLDMTLADGNVFTGTINSDGQAGAVSVTLDATSTWSLTADAYVTTFDGSLDNIVANGFTLYVNEVAAN